MYEGKVLMDIKVYICLNREFSQCDPTSVGEVFELGP